MAIGNMHKKNGKDHVCGSGNIIVDRQLDGHTHTYTLTHHNTLHPSWRQSNQAESGASTW